MYRRFNNLRLLLVLLAAQGCAGESRVGDAIVQGTVTIEGSLASRGQVTFYPEKKGPVATGPIHSDGSFSLRIGQGNRTKPDESKIYSGNYTATVIVSAPADSSSSVGEGGPPLAGPRLSSIKHASPETSDLKFSVKPGRNVFPIDLESSENDPLPEEHNNIEDPTQSLAVPSQEESQAILGKQVDADLGELHLDTKSEGKNEESALEDAEK